jgi:hypothetical protein
VRYYVLSDDGQKYGPADIPTLNAWIADNRLLPHQMLEEESSGVRIAARAVSGLNFPSAAAQETAAGAAATPPGYSGYYRGPGATGDNGEAEIKKAWTFTGISLIGFCCCSFIIPILAGFGAYFANQAKAKGHPNGQSAFVVSLIVAIIGFLYMVFGTIYVFQSGMMDTIMRGSQQ